MDKLNRQAVGDQLTQRELEIVRLTGEGLSNKQIAERLFITVGTVKWYLKQVYSKLGVSGRVQAITAVRARDAQDRSQALASRHNLPLESTPFVGRTDELAAIEERLQDPACRLLTLVGPGGIGKTRLALRAAEQHLGKFSGGVYFVGLAAIGSSGLLASAIASAAQVSLRGAESPEQQLCDFLREKQMLLVLDNFEHLLDRMPFVLDMLSNALHLKLLFTSRERLNVQLEWLLPVQGLRYPDRAEVGVADSFSAVQLFVQCARRVRPNFALGDEQTSVIAICRNVEGMPLGIEMAAGWLRAMPCDQIATAIGPELDFLKTAQRDTPARHRSLRIVCEQSWQMLSEDEKRLAAALSVFRGGFDLDSARQVAGASSASLADLADKSLLRLDPTGRYAVHELLRQFLYNKLVESDQAHSIARRYVAFFLNMGLLAHVHLTGPQQLEWLKRLDTEHDNLRAALDWALNGGDPRAGVDLAAALRWYWARRGYLAEGDGYLRTALTIAPTAPNALLAAGMLAWLRGDYAIACGQATQSLALFREQHHSRSIAEAMWLLAIAERWQGHTDAALALFDEGATFCRREQELWGLGWSLWGLADTRIVPLHQDDDDGSLQAWLNESEHIFRQLGDAFSLSFALEAQAHLAQRRGDMLAARLRLEEVLSLRRVMDDWWAVAWALFNLGDLHDAQGDLLEAQRHFEQSRSLFHDFGTRQSILATITLRLGQVARRLDDVARAKEYYRQSLILPCSEEPHTSRPLGLIGLADCACISGQPDRAARLIGAVDAFVEATGVKFNVDEQAEQTRVVKAASGLLGDARFNRLRAEGHSLSFDLAVSYALEGVPG